MGVKIEGKKYPVSDLKGTDLDALRIFCNKNKVRGAALIYYDRDGELDIILFHQNEKARRKLEYVINRMYNDENR